MLVVEHNGTPVKDYTLVQLEALTPFVGYAGYLNSVGTVVGPDAVTGVQITDIVEDAFGTPLKATQSVVVADADPADPYSRTFSCDQLVNLTGFAMYDATSQNPVAISSLLGPIGSLLIYSDPLQRLMPPSKGPLRFVVADATPENVVMWSQDSVYHVNNLNVLDPGAASQIVPARARP